MSCYKGKDYRYYVNKDIKYSKLPLLVCLVDTNIYPNSDKYLSNNIIYDAFYMNQTISRINIALNIMEKCPTDYRFLFLLNIDGKLNSFFKSKKFHLTDYTCCFQLRCSWKHIDKASMYARNFNTILDKTFDNLNYDIDYNYYGIDDSIIPLANYSIMDGFDASSCTINLNIRDKVVKNFTDSRLIKRLKNNVFEKQIP